jgi:hypothetical protein
VLLRVPVSAGELVDKISILRIKEERIADASKVANVRRELAALLPEFERLPTEPSRRESWLAALAEVNGRLWEIEDAIRACEARGDFGETFIALARSVYRTNDERARIKQEINRATGSALVEEKSYVDPDGEGS